MPIAGKWLLTAIRKANHSPRLEVKALRARPQTQMSGGVGMARSSRKWRQTFTRHVKSCCAKDWRRWRNHGWGAVWGASEYEKLCFGQFSGRHALPFPFSQTLGGIEDVHPRNMLGDR